MATPPEFISRDTSAIDRAVKQEYEQNTGKALQPAQPETLLFNAQTYRESILRSQVQDACTLNLVRFSRGAILDYQAERLGVTRLPAQRAMTTVRVAITSPSLDGGDYPFPAGTRFSNQDGSIIFETTEDYYSGDDTTPYFYWFDVPDGPNADGEYWYILLKCEASEGGIYANDLGIGTINTCLDPLWEAGAAPFITISNTTVTAGGTDQETDDNLKERVFLAPYSFSVAGPEGAYEYWARTANSGIVDVAVTNPVPGTAKLWPLYIPEGQTTPVATPTEVLDAVLEACSASNRRPVCDLVEVASPVLVTTDIEVEITRYVDADATTVSNAVTAAINALAKAKSRKLGESITPNQIVGAAMRVEGVYDVTVVTPASIISAGPTEVVVVDDTTVTITGTYNPNA